MRIHAGRILSHRPHGLRVGPKERYAAPAFQLITTACVQHGEILPLVGKIHGLLSFAYDFIAQCHVPGIMLSRTLER